MDWPKLNPGSPQQPNPRRALSPGVEIKRSSWNAGMPTNLQPPPGSPAAWQEMRRNHPPRPVSPSKYLNKPLQPIRAVSGSALTENVEFGEPLRGRSEGGSGSSDGVNHYSSSSSSSSMTTYVSGGGGRGHSRDHHHGGNEGVPPLPWAQPNDPPPYNEEASSTNTMLKDASLNSSHSDRRATSPPIPEAPSIRIDSGDTQPKNPFQFTPTYIGDKAPPPRPRASQRRGHHYKHSSVSLNFFQEPEERAPLAIPVSLAVPTLIEYWQSITKPQFTGLMWCGLRMVVALVVYTVDSDVQALAPLAHLLAYETVVSTTSACMGILANFDVWNKSSLRLPFALKRAEALVAFGLAAVLLFIGGDVISHLVQHLVQGHDHHQHQHEHQHEQHHNGGNDGGITTGGIGGRDSLAVLASVLTTFPSAIRQRKSNPLALITLLFACTVLTVPALPAPVGRLIDTALTPTIAVAMISVGWKTAKLFGGMLVMSYGGPERNDLIADELQQHAGVENVSDISLWQVHHDLWMASMRISVSGLVDELAIRQLAEAAVKRAVDVEADWETTIEFTDKRKRAK